MVCLASAHIASRKEYLRTEGQVTRGDIMVQSTKKHCGGILRKQLSEVMGVFWKSPLQNTGHRALNKLRERKTVLFCLVVLLLLGFRGATLFYPG